MPQIREQIAMVHLPPSKTLKYLFHVRKTDPKKPHNYGLFRGCAVSFCFCKNLRKNPQKSGNVILLLTLLLTQIFGADGVHGVEHRRGVYMDIPLCGGEFRVSHHLLDHRRGNVPQRQRRCRCVPA